MDQTHFTKKFMLSMLLFLLLIVVQTFTIELAAPSDFVKVIVTVLPTIALLWAFSIFKARYKSLDEYMQRLTGEAFLWVIGLVCFLTFTYGMLEMKFEMPSISMTYILPLVFGSHGLVLEVLLWIDNREK